MKTRHPCIYVCIPMVLYILSMSLSEGIFCTLLWKHDSPIPTPLYDCNITVTNIITCDKYQLLYKFTYMVGSLHKKFYGETECTSIHLLDGMYKCYMINDIIKIYHEPDDPKSNLIFNICMAFILIPISCILLSLVSYIFVVVLVKYNTRPPVPKDFIGGEELL